MFEPTTPDFLLEIMYSCTAQLARKDAAPSCSETEINHTTGVRRTKISFGEPESSIGKPENCTGETQDNLRDTRRKTSDSHQLGVRWYRTGSNNGSSNF